MFQNHIPLCHSSLIKKINTGNTKALKKKTLTLPLFLFLSLPLFQSLSLYFFLFSKHTTKRFFFLFLNKQKKSLTLHCQLVLSSQTDTVGFSPSCVFFLFFCFLQFDDTFCSELPRHWYQIQWLKLQFNGEYLCSKMFMFTFQFVCLFFFHFFSLLSIFFRFYSQLTSQTLFFIKRESHFKYSEVDRKYHSEFKDKMGERTVRKSKNVRKDWNV